MSKNLVIVESPAKAKTISKYLGKDFDVLASYRHVRDLVPKEIADYVTANRLDERFRREFGLQTLALDAIVERRTDVFMG